MPASSSKSTNISATTNTAASSTTDSGAVAGENSLDNVAEKVQSDLFLDDDDDDLDDLDDMDDDDDC